MMHDAMALLEARFLERDPKNNGQELSRYIYSMLNWIDGFKEKAPHRAYYWVCYLKNTFQPNTLQLTKLDPLFEFLDINEQNKLYVKGLDALDQLSQSYLAKITRESKLNFKDPALSAECEPLLQTYKNTPVIKDALEALCTQTDEPACVQPHWEE